MSIEAEKSFKEPSWFGKEVTDSKGIYPPVIANMTIEEVNKINEEYRQEPHSYEDAIQNEFLIIAKEKINDTNKN